MASLKVFSASMVPILLERTAIRAALAVQMGGAPEVPRPPSASPTGPPTAPHPRAQSHHTSSFPFHPPSNNTSHYTAGSPNRAPVAPADGWGVSNGPSSSSASHQTPSWTTPHDSTFESGKAGALHIRAHGMMHEEEEVVGLDEAQYWTRRLNSINEQVSHTPHAQQQQASKQFVEPTVLPSAYDTAMARTAAFAMQTPLADEWDNGYSSLHALSVALKRNVMRQHAAHMTLADFISFNVLSKMQLARVAAASYPYMPDGVGIVLCDSGRALIEAGVPAAIVAAMLKDL